jgi:3-oxoacyl-[acyl-carrier-protein] synthase-3
MNNSIILACSHLFPTTTQTSTELETAIGARGAYAPQPGIIESITGIKSRFVSGPQEYNSTLAIAASKKLFAEHPSITPNSIDLLIFASAGQDMLEPATAHIVQMGIGTNCAVLDVTNACNSFLNALEVANAFIKTGSYKRILIATGEVSTKSAKLAVTSRSDFKQSFPGYTFGDIGTAVVVTKGDSETTGIIDMRFQANSAYWEKTMLAGGGSRFQGAHDVYFAGDGSELKDAFEHMGPEFIKNVLAEHGLQIADINHVFMHQVSVPYLESFMNTCGIKASQVEETVSWCGNVAAGTLPLAWSLRSTRGELKSGDLVLLVGLAGGVSLGVALLRI